MYGSFATHRKTRKFDIQARFARLNIKFPTLLAIGWGLRHTIKTVRGSHPKMRGLTTGIPREPVVIIFGGKNYNIPK
jgi:hypothetical protein